MDELILRDSVQAGIGTNSESESTPKTAKEAESQEVKPALIDDELKKELAGIPDKMAFKIGEVADMLSVKSYVLRYWETEFDKLKPKKSSNNQRMFSRKDVETAFLIKKLLYRDRYSIEGARKAIRDLKGEVKENRKWDEVAGRYDKAIDGLESLISSIDAARKHFA